MTPEIQGKAVREVRDDPPPFLGTWRHVYVGVLCYLAALIASLYLLMRLFS